MDQQVIATIQQCLNAYEHPQRVALSRKYPALKKPILLARHVKRNIENALDRNIARDIRSNYFEHIIARHQSVLRRKLGDSDPRLQEQKVVNLKRAASQLNGLVIQPNQVFSLWEIIGKPTAKKGYVNGMLLSNGAVVEGMGGGLCQLSNFLYWIFLHAPIETVERYHHSMDVFPDSGRVLPFGSGATVLYNFVDLKVRNVSHVPLQLKLWVTDEHLKGQILSALPIPEKFHVFERNHCFIKHGENYFRFNEIYRDMSIAGVAVRTEKMTTNFAPTLYEVTPGYLEKHQFTVVDSAQLTSCNKKQMSYDICF